MKLRLGLVLMVALLVGLISAAAPLAQNVAPAPEDVSPTPEQVISQVGSQAAAGQSVADQPSPPDCSKSLQSLIDAAPAGTVVDVPACIYHETVTINKPVTLDGHGTAQIRGSD